jgi:hypothetical protein|nr:MAG TPA: hypothetical protein [Caudoviricetes sp.]DAG43258.1 MAG TPA: hypothetical protein [Bacteriophage sp.]
MLKTVRSGGGLSSFLNVNGYDFPCPRVGFTYTITTTVNAGRNANNAVIGQRVGRDLFKLDNMEWVGLEPEVWQSMLKAIEPFYVPVTFEDYRTGRPITITMYPGDRTAKPLFVDKDSHIIIKYENCKFNLIDCGLE